MTNMLKWVKGIVSRRRYRKFFRRRNRHVGDIVGSMLEASRCVRCEKFHTNCTASDVYECVGEITKAYSLSVIEKKRKNDKSTNQTYKALMAKPQ
jgi:hypothetical protein